MMRMAALLAMSVGLWSAPSQGAAAVPAKPVFTNTIRLKYREVPFTVETWWVGFTPRAQSSFFKKLPAVGAGPWIAGEITMTGAPLGMAWDRKNGRLLLDLNRDRDFTNDPEGEFGTRDRGSVEVFTNVHFSVQTRHGLSPFCADLAIHELGANQLQVELRSRCCLMGRLEVEGRPWQVAYSSFFLDYDQRVRTGALMLRPWSEAMTGPAWPATMPGAMRGFNLAADSGDGAAWIGDQANFFADGCILHLTGTAGATNDQPSMTLQVRSDRPELGEIRLTGSNVSRLLLSGSAGTIRLIEPSGPVKVPVGTYRQQTVTVRRDAAEATANVYQTLRVEKGRTVEMRLGAPLSNQVAVARRGESLQLDYQLVDVGGNRYRAGGMNQTNPPKFSVWKGPRRVATGTFEFG